MAKKGKKQIILLILTALLALGGGVAYYGYQQIFGSAVQSVDDPYFYIHSNDDFETVTSNLLEQGYILRDQAFKWVAEKKLYPGQVKPGRYKLQPGMSNTELVDLLRSGVQEPLNVTFNNTRTLHHLAGKVAKYLEADSATFDKALNDFEKAAALGFTKETYPAMFIPNTYKMNWNTSPQAFIKRMAREYKVFWSEERRSKARKLGLDPTEVSTLASIVQSETASVPEMPKVAGVYLNRIKKGMKLQADPTLIYAIGDYSIRRVLNEHKAIDSPYNTYMYAGLPPGPIRLPEIQGIDAVLSPGNHDYLYFCASPEFDGTHIFAKNYAGHLVNARKYQRALTRRGIYK